VKELTSDLGYVRIHALRTSQERLGRIGSIKKYHPLLAILRKLSRSSLQSRVDIKRDLDYRLSWIVGQGVDSE
jgi:hypothetical protein